MTEEFDKEMSPADEYVQQGQVLIGTEKFLESIVYFDKALNEDPMNQTAYITAMIQPLKEILQKHFKMIKELLFIQSYQLKSLLFLHHLEIILQTGQLF